MAATMIPKSTRNTKMYTLPPTLSDMMENIVSTAPKRLKPEYIKAPIKIPMASDIYTSFVANANIIVTTGGSNDQIVSLIIHQPSPGNR